MVKILSKIEDKKIKTTNYLIELTIGDYLKFAKDIISNNKYQRKRVRSSISIYSQLKEDLKYGCVIPPIVLAIDDNDMGQMKLNENNAEELLKKSMILDGLQRTYTILDCYDDFEKSGGDRVEFLNSKLRVEVYGGIKRFGILYRMLTLNTGQTPMTLRHQIEILYSNYDLDIDNITLIKEVDGRSPKIIGEYKFQDIIDGFISYLQADFLPMTRATILEIIKTLETISNEDVNEDLFKIFVEIYYSLSTKMASLLSEDDITKMKDALKESDILFGSGSENVISFLFAENIFSLMSKPQVMAGFGSGLSYLKQHKKISSISDIISQIDCLECGGDEPYDWFMELNVSLYGIKQSASKIGNSQRMYFHDFFRLLFDNSGDSFMNLNATAIMAKEVYKTKMG
ncbi:hypothetical protein [Abiotrophia defectiva]|uniref:hypothetical protein n=1 Tax=Abiotrophia defectiva TaxID=46125 RepID=UPI0028CFEA81|nr:hypothetical protein [Abiotrophia defectiva]